MSGSGNHFLHILVATLGVSLLGSLSGGVAARAADNLDTNLMQTDATDPYLWLEDVHGAKSMEWVKAQNARSTAVLQADPDYAADYAAILKVLDASDRIPFGGLDHNYIFNFWQDAQHPKGLWRRTTIADYAQAQPDWEILLDLDKLAADDKENWVWKDADLAPSSGQALVNLSRGGGDAVVVREFDLKSHSFLKDGFALTEAKSDITYLDDDTVLVGTDFGPGPTYVESFGMGVTTITCTAFDGTATTTATFKVGIGDVPPMVTAGPDETVDPGIVTLTAVGSDPLNRPLTYGWQLISSPVPVTLTMATAATASFLGTKAGPYVLQVTASNGSETASAMVTVTVRQLAPIANAGPSPRTGRCSRRSIRWRRCAAGATP